MTSATPNQQRDDPGTADRRREAPTRVVYACFRLVKACQLYDDANQTVTELLQPVVDAVTEFCTVFESETVRVLFTPDMVFVNRRIMRAPRDAYATALQLGALLANCELTELLIEKTISCEAIRAVARAIADGQRSPSGADRLRDGELPGVTARNVAGPDADALLDPDESPVARVIKAYAASILIVQSFYRRLDEHNHRGAHEMKRVAQKLVALGDEYPELLIAAAAAPLPDSNRARRAVSTAVVAVAMARQLSQERLMLTTLALAALMAEVGWSRLDDEGAVSRLAASALVVLTTIGKLYPAALRRNVIAFEALQQQTGADSLYGAETSPTLLAELLFVARSFNALRTPRGNSAPPAIPEVLAKLDQTTTYEMDKAYNRLLVRGLGLLPRGSLVELDSGEVAQVTGIPGVALDFARPPVRILTDGEHNILTKPLDVDLSRPQKGEPARMIRQAITAGGGLGR